MCHGSINLFFFIADLYGHLDRLKLKKDKREPLLSFYINNAYLKRTKKAETSGEDLEFDFTWGARSKIEFPTANVINFMLSVSILFVSVYFTLSMTK